MVSSPKPPDPYKTAAAQQGAELGASSSSAIINNPNEYSPYGSVNYSVAGYEQVPGADGKMQYVPRYNRTTQLSPDEQKLANLDTGSRYNMGQTALGISSRMPGYFASGVDQSGWTPWAHAAHPGEVRQDQGATDRPAIEAALMARQNEAMGKRSSAEDAQLAARGMNPGSQGYGDMWDARTRAMTDAQQQAYLASGAESRDAQAAYNAAGLQRYQMGSDWASQENQLRQAQEQSSYAARVQPLNEVASLMGLNQVNLPQFAPFSRQGINSAPIGQYVGDNYAQQSANSNAFNQGLFGIAGAGANAAGYAYGRR